MHYMEQNKFKIRYLPLFEKDLIGISFYIANVLDNPEAADKLIDDVESAILERSKSPLSFETYHSKKRREHPYYRIYVRNYTIYYVVIDNVMEIRRIIYKARDISNIL